MQPPARLRLEPRPSRIAGASIIAACSATLLLMVLLPLSGTALFASVAAIAAGAISGLRRCTGRGAPALLHVGIDRRITVTDRSGRSFSGTILDDSYVGAWLTTIVWCVDGNPWWRPARAVLILPDTLAREEFRRLRVALRYGRVGATGDTSGVDAA